MTARVESASSLSAFNACPTKYRWRYIDGIVPTESSWQALAGLAIHDALSRHWLCPRASADVCADFAIEGVEPWVTVASQEIVRAYCTHYEGDDFSAVASELPFEVRGVRGILDKRGYMPDGSLLLVDHKTVSGDISLGSNFWRQKHSVDTQVDLYLSSEDPSTPILIDAIRRYDLPIRKATPKESRKFTLPTKAYPEPRLYKGQLEFDESIEDYRARARADIESSTASRFVRGFVYRSADERRAYLKEEIQTIATIEADRLAGVWPKDQSSCLRGYYACDYAPLCFGEASRDSAAYKRRLDVI